MNFSNGIYINRDIAVSALKKMSLFHDDLNNVMNKHKIELTENLGRRNILLSHAQEIYFAEELAKYYDVECSGRTGEPDIVIKTLNKELECKLTSPQKSGAICFQSDYETLLRKGSLDYLYVVANEEFTDFAAFLYEGLTADDFHDMANGSRGKVQLCKHRAYEKLTPLVGSMVSINDQRIIALNEKIANAKTEKQLEKFNKSLNYWKTSVTKFKIHMENICE